MTPLTPDQLTKLQLLIDAWERRPRRQLDYSLLTPDSQADVQWTTDVLQALIPAVPAIREAFNLQPTPPIVIQMPPPRALPPQDEAGSPTPVSGDGQNAPAGSQTPSNQSTQAPAADAASPSTPAATAPKKGRSTGNPRKASPPARKPSAPGHKPGSAGKPASAPAIPPVAPPPVPPEPAASATPPASLVADMSDPPAPTLSAIGE